MAPPRVYFSGDFTFIAWIQLKTFVTNSRIFDFGNTNSADGIMMALGASVNMIKSYLSYNSTTLTQVITGSVLTQLNQWYHVACTLQITTFTIYVNGLAVISNSSVYVPRNVTRTANYIGVSNNAIFDDLKIYQNALSSSQILNDYKNSSNNGI